MKVTCLQENLTRGLQVVGRAVSTRGTLPILSNVLLRTDSGRLKLTATNLEIGVNCWVPAKVDDDGAITVPAKLFTDFVNNLPPGDKGPGAVDKMPALWTEAPWHCWNIRQMYESVLITETTSSRIRRSSRHCPQWAGARAEHGSGIVHTTTTATADKYISTYTERGGVA